MRLPAAARPKCERKSEKWGAGGAAGLPRCHLQLHVIVSHTQLYCVVLPLSAFQSYTGVTERCTIRLLVRRHTDCSLHHTATHLCGSFLAHRRRTDYSLHHTATARVTDPTTVNNDHHRPTSTL